MLEPQPQMQPINPVEGRPFAGPPQPLDLQPKRQPLNLQRRPQWTVSEDPNWGLRRQVNGQPNPEWRPLVERLPDNGYTRAINNPIGYTPGKALTWPLAIADRAGTIHDELTQPQPMQTLDVPSIPLPKESFPTLEETPTSRLSPDAIGNGPLTQEGAPAVAGVPGSVAGASYKIVGSHQWLNGSTWMDSVSHLDSPTTVLIGPITSYVYRINQAGQAFGSYTRWVGANGYRDTVLESANIYGQPTTRNASYSPARFDGGTDPEPQPERPPQYDRNPARKPAVDLAGLPEFLDSPEGLDLPNYTPQLQITPASPGGGEIVPYKPPPWTPPDRIPYEPPEKQAWTPPDPVPDLDTPPGQTPQKRGGPLAPPWWDAWKGFRPPDPWTNKKRGRPGQPDPRLPPSPAPTSPTPPPIAAVPYDGCCMETLAKLREIQRELEKLKVDSDIPTWSCDTTADPPAPKKENQDARDLTTVFNLLGQEIAAIREQFTICPPAPLEQAEHSEIAKDKATEGKTVWYIPLAAEVRQVELIITGELPPSFRLYETSSDGEQQAKFGALALSCAGVTGGHTANSFHQWCWTRRTSMYIGNRSPKENFLRVYVRSGLSWVLYDTGLRE